MAQWLGVFERAGFGFRFRQGDGIEIGDSPTRDGRRARIRYSTRYGSLGSGDPFPLAFRATVLGEADSVEDVQDRFWHAAMVLLPPIAVAVNGNIRDLHPLAIMEISANAENEVLHRIWPYEGVVLRQMKPVRRAGGLLDVLLATMSPADSGWLHRATLQYATALDYWRDGQELLAVQHLFMGAEVLSRVIVERQMALTHRGRDKLSKSWMLRRSELESAVRAAVIFGDQDLAKALEDVSNGLEHGYASVPDLQRAAADIRDEACARLRDAIIGTLELSPRTRKELLDDSYQRPARTDPIGSGLAGKLVGDTTPLETGDQIPFLSDSDNVTIVVREHSNGSYNLSPTYEGRVDHLPEGMLFRIERGVFSGPVANVGDVSVT